MNIQITRTLKIPDTIRLARYERAPDLGPKILFFSGGSALKNVCHELIRYTHNSIHIITPFDSGGSSAIIREAFKMLAVGDVRNRLLALADQTLHGNPEIFKLFAHRFPKDGNQDELARELDRMTSGKHKLVANVPYPMRKIIQQHISLFKEHMPNSFDLSKASIGNLILTGGFLNNQRRLDPVIYIFSRLAQVRGIVRPVVNKYLHLVAEMENGELIAGQHMFTGKEVSPISSKIKRLYLSKSRKNPTPINTPISNKTRKLISEAELICYPMGSFYSSIIANLLPGGVGNAIRKNRCPKVFVPNTAEDPELKGHDLMEQIRLIIQYLKQDAQESALPKDFINFIILDGKNNRYPGTPDYEELRNMGIDIIRAPLITRESAPYIDEKLLVPVLLSLT